MRNARAGSEALEFRGAQPRQVTCSSICYVCHAAQSIRDSCVNLTKERSRTGDAVDVGNDNDFWRRKGRHKVPPVSPVVVAEVRNRRGGRTDTSRYGVPGDGRKLRQETARDAGNEPIINHSDVKVFDG